MKTTQENHLISLPILKTILFVIDILLFTTLILHTTVSFSKTIDSFKPENNPVSIENISCDEFEEELSFLSHKNLPLTQEEIINNYVDDICLNHYSNVDPALIKSIIYQESRYNPKSKNGNCLGLMQISTHWHSDRAAKLGVTDFYDPYSNILLGVDYISELSIQYQDPVLVLMLYNMNHDTAHRMYAEGKISIYAQTVLTRAEEY
jgi:hypothetical protein